MKKIEYVGQEYETKNYGKIKVIKDLGLHKLYKNIDQRYRLLEIQFVNTGSTQVIKSSELSRLQMKDHYAKTVFNVGYIGEAKNYTKKEYDIWYHMLARCYNTNHEYYNIYGGAGVYVCTRWLNFANFLEDLRKMENYDKLMAGEKYELDKDLLQNGSIIKIYSPETCKLITHYQNTAEIYRRNLDNKEVKYNGVYNTGCKDYNEGYIARICINNKKFNLGTYDDAKSAAAVRDEIAWMYRRLDLLNHTGVTFNEAITHKRGRYNSTGIAEILSNLPPRNMCNIIDNTKLRQMCYIVHQ
jgi:hypothetical protein